MCEADVFLVDDSGEKVLFLRSVDRILMDGDELCLENIFSEKKYIRAKFKEMALTEYRIVIERIPVRG